MQYRAQQRRTFNSTMVRSGELAGTNKRVEI